METISAVLGSISRISDIEKKNLQKIQIFEIFLKIFFFAKKKFAKFWKLIPKSKILEILEIKNLRPKNHFNERIRSKKCLRKKLEPKTFTRKKKITKIHQKTGQ